MEKTLQEQLEQLLLAYSHYYDIEREEPNGFSAAAAFHVRKESYLATKSVTFAAAEQHEYVFFQTAQTLSAQEAQTLIDRAREAGLEKIVPGREHMCSYVTLVILADTIEPEAKTLIQRTRFRKNYRLALHGWMEYHIAAMECSTKSFLSNPAGKGARRTLEQNFSSGGKQ